MQLDRDSDVTGGNPTVQPEPYRDKLEMIARLRASADELEAEVPPEYRKPPDEPPRQRRHLRVIEGTGIAVAAAAAVRWLREPVAAAVVAGAAGSVLTTATLGPVILGDDRQNSSPPAVSPTAYPVGPPPIGTPAPSRPAPRPSASPSAGRTDPAPSASPTQEPTGAASPTPSAEPSPPPQVEPEPTPSSDSGTGLEEPPPDSSPTTEPPATTAPPVFEPAAYCRVDLTLPPLLRVRAICL